MHASSMLRVNDFVVRLDGNPADSDAILPDWSPADRIGIVSHRPFEALGASLLIQLAVAKFYAAEPARREANAQYPPLFLFQVGESAVGDYSSLDFWPPRREIHLPPDPYEVLGAIRDRAITRLLVPAVTPHGTDYADGAPSGWTDVHSALEQTTSSFAYSGGGRVADGDVEISATSDDPESMVRDVLQTERVVAEFESRTDQELLDLELGPSTPADFHGWLAGFRSRAQEVSPDARARLVAARGDGRGPQSFKRLPTIDALSRLVPAPASIPTQ